MKLLLFSNLHRDKAAALHLVELARDADVVVGAGDFANARTGVSTCIEILKAIETPAVLVPGNNESYDELVTACSDWRNSQVLHGTGIKIDEVSFFGIGGGIPITPFGSWSYDFSETEAEQLLQDCPTETVLISHSPPKGAVDQSSSGQSLGSTAVRDAVIRFNPRLVVCGHIHASAGKRAQIGNTTIINAGPAGVLVDL